MCNKSFLNNETPSRTTLCLKHNTTLCKNICLWQIQSHNGVLPAAKVLALYGDWENVSMSITLVIAIHTILKVFNMIIIRISAVICWNIWIVVFHIHSCPTCLECSICYIKCVCVKSGNMSLRVVFSFSTRYFRI